MLCGFAYDKHDAKKDWLVCGLNILFYQTRLTRLMSFVIAEKKLRRTLTCYLLANVSPTLSHILVDTKSSNSTVNYIP
jgi:hypothetical protein